MRLKDVVTESRRASAESVLRYVQRQHHDFRMDSEILKYPHWQLRTVPLDQLNLYNVERDDPLNRVLDIDSEHIETLRREGPAGIQSRPIVVNASGEIIDGNHRAIAAQEMGMESIPAWQPMAKNITEVFVRPGQLTKSYSAKQMVDLGIKPRRGGYYVSARDWADIVSIETGRETIQQVLARRQGLAEGKVKLFTDPDYFGAEVDDTGFDQLPVINIPTDQLVGFEPDDKMNQPKSRANVRKILAGLKRGDSLPPVLVRKYKNGYQVLDGHHRFWAYKLLGIKSIPSRIVPARDIEEKGQQDVEENFADGKKPGRRGLSKRMGVNCKQSVSKLRSIAKHSSGERQRMAHFCANMKSGRRKSK